jgi:hypothetical protein
MYGTHKPNFLVIFFCRLLSKQPTDLSAGLKAADRFVSWFGSSRQTYSVKYNIGLSAGLKAADRFVSWFESSRQICRLLPKQPTKKTTKKLG